MTDASAAGDDAEQPSLRVVLADDHPLFREGLRLVCESAGLEVVAEAEDGREAVSATEEHRPDVLVLDLQMPGLNGIEVCRQLAVRAPSTTVLMLTMFDQDDSVFAAMRAGARGYLVKGARPGEVVRAVRAVGAGDVVFGPGIAGRVMSYFAGGSGQRTPSFPELTDREREILGLIAAGLNNAEIVRRLVLSPKTVRNHISNIFAKLRVADRSEAIVRAREAGLGGDV